MTRFVPLLLNVLLLFSLATTAPAAPKKSKKTSDDSSSSSTSTKKEIPEAYPAVDGNGVPVVSAGSAIVVDASNGRVLHEVNADQKRPVASTQKLLTTLLVAETGDLDRKIVVEASDTYAEPTMLYIKPGNVYSRADFINILLVHSMNDVARALARDNAGSIEAFAAKMNARAAQLGMTSSNFVNPNGLPAPGQYSTARDMARLALAAYRNRTIRNIVCQKSITWHYNDGRTRVFDNTNRVLRNFPPCNGMKTGTTDAAGHCLVSSASYNGKDVIVVVLGDNRNVWVDSHRLLAWGLQ